MLNTQRILLPEYMYWIKNIQSFRGYATAYVERNYPGWEIIRKEGDYIIIQKTSQNDRAKTDVNDVLY